VKVAVEAHGMNARMPECLQHLRTIKIANANAKVTGTGICDKFDDEHHDCPVKQ
jgi:hypothetical protein